MLPGLAVTVEPVGPDVTKPTTPKNVTAILQANGEVMTEPRMDVAHVADAILYIANLPLEANVQFMTVMATKMPFVGRG